MLFLVASVCHRVYVIISGILIAQHEILWHSSLTPQSLIVWQLRVALWQIKAKPRKESEKLWSHRVLLAWVTEDWMLKELILWELLRWKAWYWSWFTNQKFYTGWYLDWNAGAYLASLANSGGNDSLPKRLPCIKWIIIYFLAPQISDPALEDGSRSWNLTLWK